jgi:hypothetical protein
MILYTAKKFPNFIISFVLETEGRMKIKVVLKPVFKLGFWMESR